MDITCTTMCTIPYRIISETIILTFLLVVVGPLFKLSKTRPVFMLLFSKTIISILSLLYDLSNQVNAILDFMPGFVSCYIFTSGAADTTQYLSVRLHSAALAINRTLAVYFPFWYERNVKFGLIWKICLAICIFSSTLQEIQFISKACDNYIEVCIMYFPDSPDWKNPSPDPEGPNQSPFLCFLLTRDTYALPGIYISMIFYFFMSIKLLYVKFTKREISNQSEIDHVRICIVCMVGSLPFLMQFLLEIIFADKLWEIFGFDTYFVFMQLFRYFCYLTEDLCLLLLCRDFRLMILKMFKCSAGRNSNNNVIVPLSSINANNNNIRINNWTPNS